MVDGIPGIGTDHAVHGPGGHLHAVKGQGQHESEHIHVIVVVGVIRSGIPTRGGAVPVIIEQAGPHSGQAHVFIELVVGHDTGGIIIQHGGTTGHVGHGDVLDTHAELEIRIGHHPVDVGILQLHDAVGVSAQGATGGILAPRSVTNFKVHGTGQGFGSHGIQLQAQTLHGAEGIVGVGSLIVVTRLVKLLVAHKSAVAGGKTHQPLTFGLEINGAGTGGGAQQHARSKSEGHQLFHDKNLPS